MSKVKNMLWEYGTISQLEDNLNYLGLQLEKRLPHKYDVLINGEE